MTINTTTQKPGRKPNDPEKMAKIIEYTAIMNESINSKMHVLEAFENHNIKASIVKSFIKRIRAKTERIKEENDLVELYEKCLESKFFTDVYHKAVQEAIDTKERLRDTAIKNGTKQGTIKSYYFAIRKQEVKSEKETGFIELYERYIKAGLTKLDLGKLPEYSIIIEEAIEYNMYLSDICNVSSEISDFYSCMKLRNVKTQEINDFIQLYATYIKCNSIRTMSVFKKYISIISEAIQTNVKINYIAVKNEITESAIRNCAANTKNKVDLEEVEKEFIEIYDKYIILNNENIKNEQLSVRLQRIKEYSVVLKQAISTKVAVRNITLDYGVKKDAIKGFQLGLRNLYIKTEDEIEFLSLYDEYSRMFHEGKIYSHAVENTIYATAPHLVKELHPTKNIDFDFTKQSSYSSDEVFWICFDCQYEWSTNFSSRAIHQTECPRCNSFAAKDPERLKDWDYTKNIDIDPFTILKFGKELYFWKCHSCKTEYEDVVNKKCKACTIKQSSIVERTLYFLFTEVFGVDNVENSFRIIGRTEIDIFVSKYKFGVEYDGVYWHEDKVDNDLYKNEMVDNLGYNLVRVREIGLEKLSVSDFIYDFKENLSGPFLYLMDFMVNNFVLTEQELLNIEKARLFDYDNLKIPRAFLIYPLAKNSIQETHPEIAKLFHTTKNTILTPAMLTFGMAHKCWWNCKKCNSEFEKAVNTNIKAEGLCNICNGSEIDFDTYVPESLLKEFDFEKNLNIPKHRGINCWWVCKKCSCSWEARLEARMNNQQKCPTCNYKNDINRILNSHYKIRDRYRDMNVYEDGNKIYYNDDKTEYSLHYTGGDGLLKIDRAFVNGKKIRWELAE